MSSPATPLLRKPFIRLRIIEVKDVYLDHNPCDMYATASYNNNLLCTTEVMNQCSSAVFNKKVEFDYDLETADDKKIITLSLYDSDPFGSDELIVNQIVPISRFKYTDQPNEFWLKLNYTNFYKVPDHVIIDADDTNLLGELELPYFKDQIATESEIRDKDIPKIHIALEIFDPVTISKLAVKISHTEEKFVNQQRKFLVYIIRIRRNDGLEWEIKKRYSKILEFRGQLMNSDECEEVRNILFPGKNLCRFWDLFFPNLAEKCKEALFTRRNVLERFLKRVTSINSMYNNDEFIQFFTEEQDRQ